MSGVSASLHSQYSTDMARTKEGEMKKKKAAAGRVSKSSHGNHHDLDVNMIEKKLGKKVRVKTNVVTRTSRTSRPPRVSA